MSTTADVWNPETGQWDPVCAIHLDESDRKYRYRCASCHAPAILVICSEKENYFRSHVHTVNCPEAKGHKLLRFATHTEIDIDAILNFEDRDPSPGGCASPEGGAEEGGPDPDAEENPDADLRLDPDATRTIRSASGMYKALIEKHGSEYIDSFAAREVDSIFLRRSTLRKFKEDWGSPTKLVVTKRCAPKNLKHSIPTPEGYVVLRDAYSHKDEEAIYFMVKMHHPEHDRRFKERLFGRTGKNEFGEEVKGVGKDPHRNIVILSKWTKVPHKHYQVFRAELNSRMVAFVNAPDA